MQDERSDILFSLLGVFGELDLLGDLILVGSWTHLFYREYLGDPEAVPPIRTTDVDFLVTHPKKARKKIDIPGAIRKLGFLEHQDFVQNTSKYVHNELDLEFLAERIGKGDVNVGLGTGHRGAITETGSGTDPVENGVRKHTGGMEKENLYGSGKRDAGTFPVSQWKRKSNLMRVG